MKEVVDTETTGLSVKMVIELLKSAVLIKESIPPQTNHCYLNPEKSF